MRRNERGGVQSGHLGVGAEKRDLGNSRGTFRFVT